MDCYRTFLLEEYKTLREEIGARQTRAARIVSSALFGIPSIIAVGNFFEQKFQVGESFFLMAPLVVLVSVFIYVSESTGMMRAGVYIRNSVEPVFLESGEGWEKWLFSNEHIKSRRVDTYLNVSFLVAAMLYFIGSLLAFWKFSSPLFGYPSLNSFMLILYSLLGVGAFLFAYLEVRHGYRGWLSETDLK